ncbi:hypothetical protein LTR94_032058, partial [Friedmanniomyces endolithicus]
RARGTALDLIVAEAMILANSTWGGWLNEHGVPGIYRSQASLAPGVKVRMGVRAAPHAGRRHRIPMGQERMVALARACRRHRIAEIGAGALQHRPVDRAGAFGHVDALHRLGFGRGMPAHRHPPCRDAGERQRSDDQHEPSQTPHE